MISLGANILVQQKQESGLSSTSAINGLSVAASKAVLGNNVGDATAPAQLLSSREILSAAFGVQLIDALITTAKTLLEAGHVAAENGTGDKAAELFPGAVAITDTATDFPELDFVVSNIAQVMIIANNNGILQVNSIGSNGVLEVDGGTNEVRTLGDITAQGMITTPLDVKGRSLIGTGSVQTNDPQGGADVPWQLGNVTVAASVLDGTRYLNVNVNGTNFKLALIS